MFDEACLDGWMHKKFCNNDIPVFDIYNINWEPRILGTTDKYFIIIMLDISFWFDNDMTIGQLLSARNWRQELKNTTLWIASVILLSVTLLAKHDPFSE